MSKNKEAQDVREVEESVKEFRKDVDKRLDDLKGQMNMISQKAIKTVAERPLLALAVAVVAGTIAGIALSKSSGQTKHVTGK